MAIEKITVQGVDIRYLNCRNMSFKRFEALFESKFNDSFDLKNAYKRVMEAISNHGQTDRSSEQGS